MTTAERKDTAFALCLALAVVAMCLQLFDAAKALFVFALYIGLVAPDDEPESTEFSPEGE